MNYLESKRFDLEQSSNGSTDTANTYEIQNIDFVQPVVRGYILDCPAENIKRVRFSVNGNSVLDITEHMLDKIGCRLSDKATFLPFYNYGSVNKENILDITKHKNYMRMVADNVKFVIETKESIKSIQITALTPNVLVYMSGMAGLRYLRERNSKKEEIKKDETEQPIKSDETVQESETKNEEGGLRKRFLGIF